MFYTSNFLTFDRDEMYRKVFYTFNFLERKISLTSKMFYFIYPPVFMPWQYFSQNHSILTCWSSVQMILTGHQLLKIIKMIELFNDHGKNGQIFNGVLNIFLNKQLWWLSRSTFFCSVVVCVVPPLRRRKCSRFKETPLGFGEFQTWKKDF